MILIYCILICSRLVVSHLILFYVKTIPNNCAKHISMYVLPKDPTSVKSVMCLEKEFDDTKGAERNR